MSRVLVVDNEETICLMCSLVIQEEGYAVDTARNGQEAQRLIEANRYDLLLVDLRMPLLDGKGLFGWLQRDRPALAEKVIFMSGDTFGEDSQQFLQGAGRPFLPKPFAPDDLKRVIAQSMVGRGP